MSNDTLRALIVDDEAIVRRMMTFALQQEGFSCHVAADGDEAIQIPNIADFDLVVIDLQMPHNGHALTVELLKLPSPPVLAIHTSIVEPLLVRDLIARGVDDVIFKPTNYAAFAAKMGGLVRRRRRQREQQHAQPVAVDEADNRKADETACQVPKRLAKSDVLARLSQNDTSLSMSRTALDIYELTLDLDSETADIAAAIEREPSLTSEILRLGNSSHYNASGNEISDLEQIVLRIGRRRIGELAIADNVCTSIKDAPLPHIDVDLAWRRSVSAGVAAQILIDQCRQQQMGNGLVLGTVMHLLGRILLGSTFGDQYHAMVTCARRDKATLRALEEDVFSSTQAEIMADLLHIWKIPDDVTEPLRHSDRLFSNLAPLRELDRKRAELVKTAILVGQLVAGGWEPWDLVDLPPATIIKRMEPASLTDVLRAARERLLSATSRSAAGASSGPTRDPSTVRIGYARAVDGAFDFLAPVLASMGLELAPQVAGVHDCVVVNGLDAGAHEATSLAGVRGQKQTVAICDAVSSRHFAHCDTIITLPVSYAQLNLIRELAVSSVGG